VAFDQPLEGWDVGAVTDMKGMFHGATAFNQPLGAWNVQRVTHMNSLFCECRFFNQDLQSWDMRSVHSLDHMFETTASFTCIPVRWNLNLSDTLLAQRASTVFEYSFVFRILCQNQPSLSVRDFFRKAMANPQPQPFLTKGQLLHMLPRVRDQTTVGYFGHVEQWDVSQVTDFSHLMSLAGVTSWFNYNLSHWRMTNSNVLRLDSMFAGCEVYDQPFARTFLQCTLRLDSMFERCPAFNSPVRLGNVLTVSTMEHMFAHCPRFNAPVIIQVIRPTLPCATGMFYHCVQMKQRVDLMNVTHIDLATSMFEGCEQFNLPFPLTNIRLTRAARLMYGCRSFNQPVLVDAHAFVAATDYQDMFSGCVALQHPLVFSNAPADLAAPHFDQCPAPVQWMTPAPEEDADVEENAQDVFRDLTHTSMQRRFDLDASGGLVRLPWRIYFERWNQFTVPILVIPRGTLLFTGRRQVAQSAAQSMLHLWKLFGHTSCDAAARNLDEGLLTYFFPIPYMNEVITDTFQTMDMVETTDDFRLLCLVRPSSLTRTQRLDARMHPLLQSCPTRHYDLCLSRECMRALGLQGYLAIATQDSITNHIQTLVEHIGLLLQACAIASNANGSSTLLGVPEIALLSPMCIQDIEHLPDQCQAASRGRPLPYPVPFRSVHQFVAPDTAQLINAVHADLQTNPRWSDLIGASRQAPCMLFVNKQTTTLPPDLYESIDHVFTPRDYNLTISYHNRDPRVVVAIQQGGSLMNRTRQRLRGGAVVAHPPVNITATRGHAVKKPRNTDAAEWVVRVVGGCMPVVLHRAPSKRPPTHKH
jgi:hypothetical protein